MDWLSRLFEMMPVRGRLDLRCSYGAPWRIEQGPGSANEIPYHAVLAGSAMLDDPAGTDRQALVDRLNAIERGVNNIKIPLAFADQVYVLREHISFVRNRLNVTA